MTANYPLLKMSIIAGGSCSSVMKRERVFKLYRRENSVEARSTETSELVQKLARLYEWAQNPEKLIPEVRIRRGVSATAINRIQQAYIEVDAIIFEYERELPHHPNLLEEHTRERVYEAGIKCYEAVGTRIDVLTAEAIKLGILAE